MDVPEILKSFQEMSRPLRKSPECIGDFDERSSVERIDLLSIDTAFS